MSSPERRVSPEQIEIVLDFMKKHGDLNPPIGQSPLQRKETSKLWAELARLLNSNVGSDGSMKTPDRWKRWWIDKKHQFKVKARNVSKGGPQLTSLEKSFLRVIMVQKLKIDSASEDAEKDFPYEIVNEPVNTGNVKVSTNEDILFEFLDEEEVDDVFPQESMSITKKLKTEFNPLGNGVECGDNMYLDRVRRLPKVNTSNQNGDAKPPKRHKDKEDYFWSNKMILKRMMDFETKKMDYDQKKLDLEYLKEKNVEAKQKQEFQTKQLELELRQQELEIRQQDINLKKRRLDIDFMREKNEEMRLKTHKDIELKRLEYEFREKKLQSGVS